MRTREGSKVEHIPASEAGSYLQSLRGFSFGKRKAHPRNFAAHGDTENTEDAPELESSEELRQRLLRQDKDLAKQYAQYDCFRTSPPEGFLTPETDEIEQAAEDAGLEKISHALVRDLTHMAAGGQINPGSKIDNYIRDEIKTVNGTKPKDSDFEETYNQRKDYHRRINDFMKRIDYERVPGATALEKAITVLKVLESSGYGAGHGCGVAAGEASECQNSYDRQLASGTEQVDKAEELLEAALEMLEQLEDVEIQLLTAGDGATKTGHPGLTQKREALEALLTDPLKARMVEIARKLKEYSEMSVSGEIKEEVCPDGDDVRRRQMDSLHELPKIDRKNWGLYSKAPELFWLRAIANEYQVKERVKRTGKKQLLYMLIDCSFSMNSTHRIGAALGILMNRLKAVVEGDAELYVRFFDTSCYEEKRATNAEEAFALMAEIKEGNFSGGGTDIDTALRTGIESINSLMEGEWLVRPHMVIVTDGGDTVTTKESELPETTLHSFFCGGDNEDLAKLAKNTGGVYESL